MRLLLNADSIVVIHNYIGKVEGLYSCNREVCIAIVIGVTIVLSLLILSIYKYFNNRQELNLLKKMHKIDEKRIGVINRFKEWLFGSDIK